MAESRARVVREIPAMIRQNYQSITKKEVVCGYARVSTDHDEQEDSFERQCEHFSEMINKNPEWEFGGVYADQGISGTKAEKRPEFMRMIADCREGKINRILVKSISRFARNTVDTLKYIRELKELGVGVFFETQNIDTMTQGGEILITILAATAEQESRNISSSIKWAYRNRFKQGRVLINSRMLGYKKDGEEYVIAEEEAELVRRIFREYLSGKTYRQIADALTKENCKTGANKTKWRDSTIQGILKNEKYTGNAILGKTFKTDVLSKQRQENKGQEPQFYVENSHPAIITQEMFDMAKVEQERRREIRSATKHGEGRYTSKYPLSGLLVCAECGSKFRRYGRKLASGQFVATWVCINHQNHPEQCAMLPLKEEDILKAYDEAVNQLIGDTSEVVKEVQEKVQCELNMGQIESLSQIEQEIIIRQEECISLLDNREKGVVKHDEYFAKTEQLREEIIRLKEKEDEIKNGNMKVLIAKDRLEKITEILQDKNVNHHDPDIMKTMIERIKVIGKRELEIVFTCGIAIKKEIK